MLKYLQEFYKKLIESVLDPVADWIFNLSWAARLLILLAIVAGIAVWQRPAIVLDMATYTERLVRVIAADSDTIPLASKVRDRVAKAKTRLLLANTNDVNMIDEGVFTGWSAAQTLLSIAQPGNLVDEEAKLIAYIRTKQLAACHCWAELNDENEKKAWIFVSGWVMSALANKGVPATEMELGFLLDYQNPDGSWPAIPKRDLAGFESLNATSWAIIGLRLQLDKKLISSPILAEKAKTAVRRGATWLFRAREPNARWKPYPNTRSSTISGSISGLALHALHLSGHGDTTEIDREWLNNLPASPVPASLAETYYVEIKRGGTLQIDHFMYLTMPWMLIATIDAYSSGGIFERTRALGWMEETLLHESVRNADAEQGNWWRAELLIAINYLHMRMNGKPAST